MHEQFQQTDPGIDKCVVCRDSRMAYRAYAVAFPPMPLTPRHLFPPGLHARSSSDSRRAGVGTNFKVISMTPKLQWAGQTTAEESSQPSAKKPCREYTAASRWLNAIFWATCGENLSLIVRRMETDKTDVVMKEEMRSHSSQRWWFLPWKSPPQPPPSCNMCESKRDCHSAGSIRARVDRPPR